MRKSRAYQRRTGLTLVEVSVSTLIIALLLVTSLQAVQAVLRTQRTTAERLDIEQLADELMAEILRQPYEEPDDPPLFGREAGEDPGLRAQYDDVDDYHGWSSVAEDQSGVPLPGRAGWTRSVTIEWVDVSDPTLTAGADEGLKRILVDAVSPTGATLRLVAHRSRWGLLEQPLATPTSIQVQAGVKMRVGNSDPSYTGTPLVNHPVGP